MTPRLFLDLAVRPAVLLLPKEMDSAEARAMILAIALQESRIQHRRQIGGPARGYCQFEEGGGVRGVLRHDASRESARQLCEALDIPANVNDVYEAIAWNDVLCAGFARLLLWTLPGTLPGQNEAGDGWECYIDGWRPGKPHKATWDMFFEIAWETVLGHPTEGVIKV